MILGTISAVDSVNGLQLIIDGEDDPTTKKYTYMASYVPSANDRVLIEEIGGSYVIMGKVISDVASSGIARTAETATTATTADTAVNAQSATTAATCTGNAATATTAASCTGNAATATVSDTTKGFDSTVFSTYGQLVTRVDRSYNSQLGTYIVTDVQLAYGSHNFVYKY